MNTSDTFDTTDTPGTSDAPRPIGYWLTTTERLLANEFRTALEEEHADRRDWRLLSVIDGTAPARHPLTPHRLHRLVERGWVSSDGDGWALTDDGRAAKDRLGAIVDGIRAKVADAVSPEEMAATLASLEKIARALGWDEETPLPRGRRHGRGFGHRRGFGHGFAGLGGRGREFPGFGGRGFQHAPGGLGERGHGHEFPGRGHEFPGHRHGGHRAARLAQHAYERGFDAGFGRGRDA